MCNTVGKIPGITLYNQKAYTGVVMVAGDVLVIL